MSTAPGLSETTMKNFDAASRSVMTAAGAQPATETRLVVSPAEMDNPIMEVAVLGAKAAPADICGAFSIENFYSAGGLTYTHEDAEGWLAYWQKFYAPNFWYKDAGVGVWAYYETYDNWQHTYGMDAVRAVYHSGHGGMAADGTFYAPMGSNWGGESTTYSSRMALGNEMVRYIFWSTCYSCRISGGHSPIRTWYNPDLGFRMLFGYETTSVDDPDYGKKFWNHWCAGDSLSTAFLDASWDISHSQVPVVVACGATQKEASDRVFSERYFYPEAVSKAWWWWRWYSASTSAMATRQTTLRLPKELLVAALEPRVLNSSTIRKLLQDLPVGLPIPAEIKTNSRGIAVIADGTRHLAMHPDGSYRIRFSEPNRENTTELPVAIAVRNASDFIRRHGLDGLILDRVLDNYEAGGSIEGSGRMETPRVTAKTVQFTQTINGLPVLTPSAGKLAVTIDNDQNIVSLVNTVKPVAKLIDSAKFTPPEPGAVERHLPAASVEPEELLRVAWQDKLKTAVIKGNMPASFAPVPGTTEIGYAFRGQTAVLVARQEMEVDCGGGFLKRYIIETPISE